MSQSTIDHLIINSPYEEPKAYWKRDSSTLLFDKVEGRRPAGYFVATPGANPVNDAGTFIPIPLVEAIRPRVQEWRASGYPGATGTTKRLLEHWYKLDERREDRRFFFCQLEAMETLIWLIEAPASERVGIDIPSDGGTFARLCAKMATGSGKTIVMALLIAWQSLNKIIDSQNSAYSKNFLVIAPGLTVKRRLQVLLPSAEGNFYDDFNIVPSGLRDKLNQANILIHNWHTLQWETEADLAKKKSVDKRGAKSDTAYAREVLNELGNAQNIVVINDEAHHAWRIPPGAHSVLASKDEIEQATIWVGGLDRIHRTRGILTAYDFSATPFASIGKKGSEEVLFKWIVSDFGLNDAIESGLVKTPRIVVRTDAAMDATYRPLLYHIYPHVREDLNRRVPEQTPLDDLVINAYTLLGKDWLETYKTWRDANFPTPPVMITVANRTETAARIKYAFDHNGFHLDELTAPERTIHIDSKVLEMAEEQDIDEPASIDDDVSNNLTDVLSLSEGTEPPNHQPRKQTKKEQAAQLRETVDTVGKVGQPGAQIQNVISVGMLSEGWDAKTVTHIMGLRAFNSQLLCEQVVGRGLRRTSYEVDEATGLYRPEYVNIFGVPFTFMPHEETGTEPPKPDKPRFAVEPNPSKRTYEITWPQILRVDHIYKPQLSLDLKKVPALYLDAYKTNTLAELAPVVDGQPDITHISSIDLLEFGKKYRTQKIIFESARQVYDQMQQNWNGNREMLLAQVIRLVESFITSNKIHINPPLFNQDDLRRRIVITLNMNSIVQHIWSQLHFQNTEQLVPVFDTERPIRSTADMQTWYTTRPWQIPQKSHINRVVYDSTWEANETFEFDRNDIVTAWVKNDHLGFVVHYSFQGVIHTYYPDFLIRLQNGTMLILETKGRDDQQNRTKREFLDEWVEAVNADGRFGRWMWTVSKNPADLRGILEKVIME